MVLAERDNGPDAVSNLDIPQKKDKDKDKSKDKGKNNRRNKSKGNAREKYKVKLKMQRQKQPQTRPSKQCEFHIYLHDKSFNIFRFASVVQLVRVVPVIKFANVYGLHGLNNQIIEKT